MGHDSQTHRDESLKDRFPNYYPPTEKDFKELWSKCHFVLDANVLLNLYRYPEKARDDLIGVLTKVRGRLWVPHQVAMEYQRNRLSVIAEQKRRFSEVGKLVDGLLPSLSGQLDSMQLGKRHSTIDPTKFLEDIRKAADSFRAVLKPLEKKQLDVHEKDPIRDQLDSLLAVGRGPKDQSELDSLLSDAESRSADRMPPGFRDESKHETKLPVFFHDGIRYERRHGDLILWKQIISYARSSKVPGLVFVTDDDKEDWWRFSDTKARKRVGPRPELIDELRKNSSVVQFHMYNSERFLQYAQQYLKIEIAEESITQVKEVRQSIADAERASGGHVSLNRAVTAWFLATGHIIEAVEKEPFLHFIASDDLEKRYGVFIRPYDVQHGAIGTLRQSMKLAHSAAKRQGCDGAHIVIGISHRMELDLLKARLTPALPAVGQGITLTVGMLDIAEGASQFDALVTYP